MLKTILFCVLSFISFSLTAQIRGNVVDINNKTLPYVNIYLKNSLSGTISNDNGIYELSIKKLGKHTIVFQFLGFKTLEKTVTISSLPFTLNVKMIPEQVLLNEVEISSKENPANSIIRNVIASKEKNTNKSGKYTADFYSRGLFKIKDAPKKILGQEVGDLGGGLDSTRSGIIYLSETISKINYQKKPKKFKEVIIASKVSGESNGIAFNSADEVNFNLYPNQISIADAQLFSPIANYAFSYYNYKLEGTFYEKNGKLINKIQLLPKRENDRVFGGYIYVVEDDWAIYGADLTVSGSQINNPAIDILHIKQNYNYDEKAQIWALILQTIDFKIGFLDFKMDGRFSASYSNYNFQPTYTKKTFSKKVLSFEKEATKKDTAYWNALRPVPLTAEEKRDYTRKDSITTRITSKKYLDSVDTKNNQFKLLSPLLGYSYRNSHKKWNFSFDGPLLKTRFNTVQGFNTSLDFRYTKRNNDIGNNWSTNLNLNYGFSEKKIRPLISFTKNWNLFERPRLRIEIGTKINQFDEKEPISSIVNSLSSLILKDNFAKYYEKNFAKVNFSQELINGFRFFYSLEYADRKPLFNTTDFSFFNKDEFYTANNPVSRSVFEPSFIAHQIFSTTLGAQIHFGSKYISYPDSNYPIYNKKYPTLYVGYRKNFGFRTRVFNSDFLHAKLNQSIGLASLGDFKYNAKAGFFFKRRDIAFMDYYHPLANETILAPKDPLSGFNLLPYYQLSTDDAFAEIHTQHHFKGFLLNKIPLLRKLKFQTVISAKSYFSANSKPYTEFGIGLDNIGWGKWRFFRLDYVQSYQNGNKQNGFVLGLNIF